MSKVDYMNIDSGAEENKFYFQAIEQINQFIDSNEVEIPTNLATRLKLMAEKFGKVMYSEGYDRSWRTHIIFVPEVLGIFIKFSNEQAFAEGTWMVGCRLTQWMDDSEMDVDGWTTVIFKGGEGLDSYNSYAPCAPRKNLIYYIKEVLDLWNSETDELAERYADLKANYVSEWGQKRWRKSYPNAELDFDLKQIVEHHPDGTCYEIAKATADNSPVIKDLPRYLVLRKDRAEDWIPGWVLPTPSSIS